MLARGVLPVRYRVVMEDRRREASGRRWGDGASGVSAVAILRWACSRLPSCADVDAGHRAGARSSTRSRLNTEYADALAFVLWRTSAVAIQPGALHR